MGIAWDRYNFRVVQQFEGDYVKFERRPMLADGLLSFKGSLHNGAALDPDNIKRDLVVQIYYDPPLQKLTRGQLARSYSSSYVTLTAAVRPQAGDGYYYVSDSFTQQICSGRDPYEVPPDASAPQTPEESHWRHNVPRTMACVTSRVPWLDASIWKLRTDSFDVRVNVKSVLKTHGSGIYTVVLWANIDGDQEVVSEYPIFYETKLPDGYGS